MRETTIDLKRGSDEQILARSVAKPSCFEEIVARYEDAFSRKARAIVGNREEVHDIVQDTFTKIYLNAGRFVERGDGNFRAWGYKILCNTAFTYYKKFKREIETRVYVDQEILETYPGDNDDTTYTSYFEKETIFLLSKLPRDFSRVLRMFFLEGRPQKEIAELENISLGAVKTRIHRAKQELKKVATDSNFTL